MIDEKMLDALLKELKLLPNFSVSEDELIRLARLGLIFEKALKDQPAAQAFMEAATRVASGAQDEYILSSIRKP